MGRRATVFGLAVAAVAAVLAGSVGVATARPAATTQFLPPWHLDRLDEGWLPYNGKYTYRESGRGVIAYVFDEGIRASHNELRGRVTIGLPGRPRTQALCGFHGTAVASALGGKTVGVAKGVDIVSVSVLCDPQFFYSDLIDGLNYVAAKHGTGTIDLGVNPQPQPAKRAVVNLSVATAWSPQLQEAVQRVIAAGVPVITGAGNDFSPIAANRNACDLNGITKIPGVITAGATNRLDGLAYWSNRGPCVDILAPGMLVPVALYKTDWLIAPLPGTSFSGPFVAGAAAQILERSPKATVAEVEDELKRNALKGRVWGVPKDTPNLLLQISK